MFPGATDKAAELSILATFRIQLRPSLSVASLNEDRFFFHGSYGPPINARGRIDKVFGWINQVTCLWLLKDKSPSKLGAFLRLLVVAYGLNCLAILPDPQQLPVLSEMVTFVPGRFSTNERKESNKKATDRPTAGQQWHCPLANDNGDIYSPALDY